MCATCARDTYDIWPELNLPHPPFHSHPGNDQQVRQYRAEAALDYSYNGLGSGSEHEVSFSTDASGGGGGSDAMEMTSSY